MLRSGDPRTIVPAVARAYVSIRLAPGQSAAGIRAEVERMVRNGVPEGAEVGFEWHEGSEAAAFDASSPPLRLAREALATVCGTEPLLWRLGASIPILSSFAERGIQTIVSGFAGPSDNIHAPNESYALDSLEQGRKASFELYRRLAELPGGGP
jgi:acetylornithine deacetylase/succinyl-diaminopimelate desuccinylase-like protein